MPIEPPPASPLLKLVIYLSAVVMAILMLLAIKSAPVAPPTGPGGAKLPVAAVPTSRGRLWRQWHAEMVAQARRGGIGLLFAGDSITDHWRDDGREAWDRHFAPLGAANFGMGGDETGHLLWRLQNGALEGIEPKLVVLMIGTNNTAAGHRPEDTAAGVAAIIETIRARCPKAKVLLLAILPRGPDARDPLRLVNQQVNALLARFDDGGRTVRFLDIGARFLRPDGSPIEELMAPDLLHLSPEGYAVEAEAILPVVREMMGL